MSERKYPCQAIVNLPPEHGPTNIEGLHGTEITVLEKERYHNCCCDVGHRVELPDGFPEPPKNCATWLMRSKYLQFLE